jgi:DNA polymerase-3 subunit alpha
MKQKDWDKIYQSQMDVVREWLKENYKEILDKYNELLFMETWEKYALGTVSHWEMEALAFYHGDHELKNVDVNKYNLADFNKLESEEIDYFINRKGHQIPIYKLYRIAGTVIAKNDNRHIVTLLTTTGVVPVKFTREYYSLFKKQVSQIQPDGTKKIVEKSWFKRGTILMVTGFKRDEQFVGKTYANTTTHQLYKIIDIVGDEIKLQHERATSNGELEEDYDDN